MNFNSWQLLDSRNMTVEVGDVLTAKDGSLYEVLSGRQPSSQEPHGTVVVTSPHDGTVMTTTPWTFFCRWVHQA